MTLKRIGQRITATVATQPCLMANAPTRQYAPMATSGHFTHAGRKSKMVRGYLKALMFVGALFVPLFVPVAPVVEAQQGTPAPVGRQQFFSNTGVPLAGGKLYTYVAGTTTPLATYTSVTLAPGTENSNPIILDSAGRTPSGFFLTAASYKFVLKTSADVTIWSADNIASAGLAGSFTNLTVQPLYGDDASPITATSYPSGTTYAELHAGTLIFNIDSANLTGTYAFECMLLGSGGTVSAALMNLSDGSPDTALVTISSASATGERQISSTITFAASGAAKNYGVKVKVSAGTGLAWGCGIKRTA